MKAVLEARFAARRPQTVALVVFISDRPGWREAKLAYGLQQNGWQVVLLHRNELTSDISKFFVETHRYENPTEALLLACRYSPVAYHVFSLWGFDTAATIIRRKPGKIVFDDYDVLAGMVKEDFADRHYPGQMRLERFCLENADGLCCRSLETQYAKKFMGYKYSGKRIFFSEYCWNTVESGSKKFGNGDFTVANVGNLYIDPKQDIGHPANYHLKLALLLSEHRIGSYLFVAFLTTEIDSFLRKTLRGNPYIRYTHAPATQLIHELRSHCHAGLICAPPGATSRPDDPYSPLKRKYGASNKVFDYIDADLPMIVEHESSFVHRFARRYHLVFDFGEFMANLTEFPGIVAESLLKSRERLSRSKATLSVSQQAKRLIKFYEYMSKE